MNLQCELARRGDDQCARLSRRTGAFRIAEQGLGNRDAKRHGFSRSGLGGDQQIAIARFRGHDGSLNSGGLAIRTCVECATQSGVNYVK